MEAQVAPALDAARFALEQRARAWKAQVRVLTERMLSLGAGYEVQYTFPRARAAHAAAPSGLMDLGFDVTAIYAHIFSVKQVHAARVPRRFVEPGGDRASAIDSIAVDDILVGIDGDNLVLCPVRIARLHARAGAVLRRCAREQEEGVDSTVRLRFIRYRSDAPAALRANRDHGRVMQLLSTLQEHTQMLAKQYEAFQSQDRALSNRLQTEKKVLMYVRINLHMSRDALLKSLEFNFMAGFLKWRTAQDTPLCFFDEDLELDDEVGLFDEDDDMDGQEATYEFGGGNTVDMVDDYEESHVATIRDSPEHYRGDAIDLTNPDDDSDDEEFVEVLNLAPTTPTMSRPPRSLGLGRTNSVHSIPSPRPDTVVAHRPRVLARANSVPAISGTRVQPKPKPPKRQAPVCNIDSSWINAYPMQDLKWISNARTVLETFTNGVADSFQADYAIDENIATLCCSIARSLFNMYLRKRGSLANLQKEFTRHARMLRSNLKNPQNPELRRDLVDGKITPARLCTMSSDELAPEALRKEREARFEKHAQQNTLREPTGKKLVKTKDGYKEVGFTDPSTEAGAEGEENLPTLASIQLNLGRPQTLSSEPVSNAIDTETTDGNDTGSNPFELDAVVYRTSHSDVLQSNPPRDHGAEATRFQASIGIKEKPHPGPTRSTSPNTLAMQPTLVLSNSSVQAARINSPKTATTSTQALHPQSANTHGSQLSVPNERAVEELAHRYREVTAPEGQAFLVTLFGPTYDVISQLQEFAATLRDAPLSKSSREFNLVPTVKLFRSLTTSASGTAYTSVQLGHLYRKSRARNDQDATAEAVEQLLRTLIEFQRFFGDLLRRLSLNYRLIPSNDSRQVRDAALNYLLEGHFVKLTTREVRRFYNGAYVVETDVIATIDSLPIAHTRGTSARLATADTIQSMMTFLINLVEQFEQNQAQRKEEFRSHQTSAPAPAPQLHPAPPQAPSRSESAFKNESAPRMSPDRMEVYDDGFSYEGDHRRQNTRKRQFEPIPGQNPELTRDSTRRRIDSGSVNSAPSESSGFFVDAVGETPQKPKPSPGILMKAQALAYQDLLTLLFKDSDQVFKDLKAVDWRDQSEVFFAFTPRIQMTGTITQGPSETSCELTAMEGALCAKGVGRSAVEAKEAAIQNMKYVVARIHECWKHLLQTFKERRKHTPTTLMAGNETQQRHLYQAVGKPGMWKIVRPEEKLMSLPTYCIYVDEKLAVFASAATKKDAKRSANEYFRDIIEGLCKVEGAGPSANSDGGPAIREPAPQPKVRSAPATSAKPRITQAIIASDDSGDDNYDSSGGESDWDPNETKPAEPNPPSSLDKLSSHGIVNPVAYEAKLMNEKYDIATESGGSDDAKFRAVIRSLFTPSDELCAGISYLRGSLKYRGSAEKTIVSNVKASIRIDRLREGVFEVRVDVNDVVSFKAAKLVKPDAINAAIDGILTTLYSMRGLWAQMLHFLHIRCLSDNFLTAYRAMTLTGILSVKPVVDPPLSSFRASTTSVRVAMWVGEHVVYRVIGHDEKEALILADCRVAKFFEDLIDSGLDQEEHDSKDNVLDAADGALTAEGSAPDWSGRIRVQDTGDSMLYHDFRIVAKWSRPHSLPTERDFPREDVVITQTGTVAMGELESILKNRHESAMLFFRLGSEHEETKLIQCIASHGNKARHRANALLLTPAGGSRFDVYVIPPGATVNSAGNLYWPKNFLPRHIREDRKGVYGFLTPKHL